MCVICRLRAPQNELTRHAGSTGRGWYVCAKPGCQAALARREKKRACAA
jgi:predicted RNA-binding protein YlxR (DUF448 family)